MHIAVIDIATAMLRLQRCVYPFPSGFDGKATPYHSPSDCVFVSPVLVLNVIILILVT